MQGFLKGGVLKYQAALDEIQRLGDLSLNCKILANMGEAYSKSGQFEDAIIHLEDSLEISKAIRDRDQEGKTLCLLGISWADSVFSNRIDEGSEVVEAKNKRMNTYEKAASFITLSKEIFNSLGDKFLLGWAFEMESRISLMKDDWNGAIQSCKLARKLKYDSPYIHMNLAYCYSMLKDERLSKVQQEIARKKLTEAESNDYDIACLESIRHNYNEAFKLLTNSLKIGFGRRASILRDPLLKGLCMNPFYLNKINEMDNLSDYHMKHFM